MRKKKEEEESRQFSNSILSDGNLLERKREREQETKK